MKSVSNKDYNIKEEQKQYKHLDIKERVKIETMMNDQLEVYGKVNITKIAQKLNRSKSTISKEIKRNRRMVVTEVYKKESIFKRKKEITFSMKVQKLMQKHLESKEKKE